MNEEAKFDRRRCPRCHGKKQFVGHNGKVLGDCFRCNGEGKVLTQRGEAAHNYFLSQFYVTPDKLREGDVVRIPQPTMFGQINYVWRTLDSLTVSVSNAWCNFHCVFTDRSFHVFSSEDRVMRRTSPAHREAALKKALQFQSKLDGHGQQVIS